MALSGAKGHSGSIVNHNLHNIYIVPSKIYTFAYKNYTPFTLTDIKKETSNAEYTLLVFNKFPIVMVCLFD